VRRAAAAVLVVLALTGCSGGQATGEVTPSAPPLVVTPLPSPSVTQEPTPQEEFALEVEELYALVKQSVEGSNDHASSAEVLSAFATTVALVRVEPEQNADRQRVVDAAESAAQSYRTAAGITGGIERAAAVRQAVVLLRELERVIRTLPTESPSPSPSSVDEASPVD
jgi:hypothetical protein